MKCTTPSPVAVIALLYSCDTVENQEHKTPPLPVKGESPLPLIQESSYRNLPSNTHLDCRRTKTAVASIDWQPIESVLGQAQRILDTEYVAVFGVQDSSGNFYSYHLQELAFSPETVEQGGGKVRPYIYEFLAESGPGLLTTRIAIAYIPDTELAEQSMTSWLLPNIVKDQATEPPAKRAKVGTLESEQTCYYSMYIRGGEITFVLEYCELDEIVVSPGPECDGGGSGGGSRNDDVSQWNWPRPRGGGGGSGNRPGSDNPEQCRPPYCEEPDYSTPPEGVQPHIYNRLTQEEKKLCWQNPNICIGVYNASVEADEWARSKDSRGTNNGIQDALRHTMWNAIMAFEYGADNAKKWGDAHESESTEKDEIKMDLHNNAAGREIGQDVRDENRPRNNLGNEVLEASNSGKLCLDVSTC